jgi:hypothetical protein
MKFDIYNQGSGHSLGQWEADTPESALENCAREAGYTDVDDMRLQTLGELVVTEVTGCADCGAEAETRECYQCGRIEQVIDCGHYAQPAVISAGREDGTDMDNWYCEDCGAE